MLMNLAFIISILLVLGVVFVNGWTDAPNAIGTAVATRVLKPRTAIIVAIIFNFLGVLLMTLISTEVADTISKMVDFKTTSNVNAPLIALTAALFSIVIWAIAAWYFGIPTSESHALIAGITGGALALGGFEAIDMMQWLKVIIGLLVSSILGFGSGFGITRLIERICRNKDKRKTDGFFTKGSGIAASIMAFLHGAQDGQKFMSVFMLALFLNGMAGKNASGTFDIPIWVMVLCSLVMGLGTAVGGWRIIKVVGMGMVKLKKYQGFASDISAGLCLLLSSLTGLPVSTTHTKTTAIMGVGASKRLSCVNWGVAREMVLAWVLTFPGCIIIGFIMSKLFLVIF